jgi:hypothetical protein
MATANSTMAQNQYLSRPTSPKMARKCGEGVEICRLRIRTNLIGQVDRWPTQARFWLE